MQLLLPIALSCCYTGTVMEIHPPRTSSIYPVNRKFPLHALPIACGYGYETDVAYRWDGMRRGTSDFTVLQYTLDGEGVLEMDGVNYRLAPSSLMTIPVPSRHIYYLPSDSPLWSFFFLTATGSETTRIVRGVVQDFGPVHVLPENSRVISEFQRLVDIWMQGEPHSSFALSADLYRLLMLLMEVLQDTVTVHDPPWMLRVKQLCRDESHRDISIQEMADCAHLSRFHFSREFARLEGTTPGKYQERERMRRAMQLLSTVTEPIYRIAARCGYPDVNYFCRVFKRTTGMTPGSYRKRGR